MSWKVRYHPAVAEDLEALGSSTAARIMKVIDARIHRGEPDKLGKALGGEMAGCRRLRTGPFRIVYQVDHQRKEVVVLGVGPRRQGEVYKTASRRL